MKKLSLLLMVVFISACANNPVTMQNLSPNQKEIMLFFDELQKMWNAKNQNGYLALWHPNSNIMYSPERIVVPKDKFSEIIAERMKISPLMDMNFSDITVKDNSAIVKASGSPDGRSLIYLTMNLVRENGKWYLMNWKY